MPSKIYNYFIDKDKINSIHSIVVELDKLNNYLNGTKLNTLKFFNSVYIFVDKELENAVSSGIFSHPKIVKKLDIIFSLYYFDALNYFTEHKKLPELWNTIIKKGIFTPFYFLLGANVHINHDLPLAITASVPNLKEFKEDFYKIDKIIKIAIKNFFKTYKPVGNFAFIKYFLVSLFRNPTTLIIIAWRRKAWHSAELISEQKLTNKDLIQKTKKISKKLVWYGTII